jgi:predicted ester cyclase
MQPLSGCGLTAIRCGKLRFRPLETQSSIRKRARRQLEYERQQKDRAAHRRQGEATAMSNALAMWDAVWTAVENGRLVDLDDLFADDITFRTSSAEGIGRDYAKGVLSRHLQSYPDLGRDVVDTVESGDGSSVVVELFFHGTHKGTLRHPDGKVIEPTGRELRWRAFDKVTVADDRITSWCAMFDRLHLLQQLS